MSKAYLQIWIREPIADGEFYESSFSDQEGVTFLSQTPFEFDINKEDPFEPRLSVALHDDVQTIHTDADCAWGVIEFPDVILRNTEVGHHKVETAWFTVMYEVMQDTSVTWPCFTTEITCVTLPNAEIQMRKSSYL